ncbi:MAG: hypothetical protein ACRDHY_03220, partial [Anaerolineales bacterium]
FGCVLAIGSDAHHPDHLPFRSFGVGIARRAWATRQNILNTWPLAEVEAWLGGRGKPGARNRG